MQRPGPRNRLLNRDPRNPKVSTAVSSWLNFNPLVVSDLGGWFDASDTATITESGGAVSQWNDKSGNGRNLTQGTAARQPVTGTTTRNSRNVVVFADDYMASGTFTQAQPITIFVVAQLTGGTGANYQIIGDNNISPTVYTNTANRWFAYAGVELDGTVDNDLGWHQINNLYNGSSSVMRLDGRQIASGNTGTSGFTNARFSFGNTPALNRGSNVSIAEVLFYFRLLTSSEQLLVESYLTSKWGPF